jgi:hypothetical protein
VGLSDSREIERLLETHGVGFRLSACDKRPAFDLVQPIVMMKHRDVGSTTHACEKNFNYQLKLNMALKKARLYGGSAIVIGVDQGKFNEELDVKKGR